jgi:DedD protein
MKLKQRLIGAVVLAAIIIIFIPTLFKNSSTTTREPVNLNAAIPAPPTKPVKQIQQNNTANENDIITLNNDAAPAANNNGTPAPTPQAQSSQAASQPAQAQEMNSAHSQPPLPMPAAPSAQSQQTLPLQSPAPSAEQSSNAAPPTSAQSVPLPESKYAAHSVFADANRSNLSSNTNNISPSSAPTGSAAVNSSNDSAPVAASSENSAAIQQEADKISASEQKLVAVANPPATHQSKTHAKTESHKNIKRHVSENEGMEKASAIHAENHSALSSREASIQKTSPEISAEKKSASADMVKKSVEQSISAEEKPVTVASAWILQVGVFSEPANVTALVKKLESQGFTVSTRKVKIGKKNMTRVLIGPETRHTEAEKIKTKLEHEMKLKILVEPYESLK